MESDLATRLVCKVCGKQGRILTKGNPGHHGGFPDGLYISCVCGIQTKQLIPTLDGNQMECVDKLIHIWEGTSDFYSQCD